MPALIGPSSPFRGHNHSSSANLTVTPDVTPPRIVKATVGDSLAIVSIEFSERMDSGGLADSFSYVLTDSGGGLLTVFGATPLGPTKVRLSTDPLTLGATYHLSLVDIRTWRATFRRLTIRSPFPRLTASAAD
jgi:hypothetical protein